VTVLVGIIIMSQKHPVPEKTVRKREPTFSTSLHIIKQFCIVVKNESGGANILSKHQN
jgi:hypothetical protein